MGWQTYTLKRCRRLALPALRLLPSCTLARPSAPNAPLQSSSQFGNSGGAVLVSRSSNVRFENCHFLASCAAGSGGAFAVHDSEDVTLSSGSFTGNRASKDGGAVALVDSDMVALREMSFIGNGAPVGGALSAHGGSGSSIHGCTFNANQAREYAPALYLHAVEELELGLSNVFEGNTADGQQPDLPVYVASGGVVYTYSRSDASISAQCGGGGEQQEAAMKSGADSASTRTVAISDVALANLPASVEPSDVRVRVRGGGGSKAEGALSSLHAPLLVEAADEEETELVVEALAGGGGRRPTSLGRATLRLGAREAGTGTFALEGRRGAKRDGKGNRTLEEANPQITFRWVHAETDDRAPGALREAAGALAQGRATPRSGFGAGLLAGVSATALVAAVALRAAARRGAAPLPMA